MRPLLICLLLAATVASAPPAPAIAFEDVTARSGVEFVLRNGAVPGEKRPYDNSGNFIPRPFAPGAPIGAWGGIRFKW